MATFVREFAKRHRATLVSFIVLTLPLFVLYLHGRRREGQTFLETALMVVTAPAQRVMSSAMSWVGDVWSSYIALVNVHDDNERLAAENEILRGLALEGKRLALENERLRTLCEFKRKRGDLHTVPARVVSKDVSPYFRVVRLYIDAGGGDGVKSGMPVITADGVVGRVERVTGRYADVMLTVDTRSRIDVTIAGKGVTGVLHGRGARNAYGARFSYLHRGKPVEKDDTVVTTGHDRVFPAGLEVGYIADPREHQEGMFYEFDVLPAVNFSTIEEVLVVTSPIEAPPSAKENRQP